MSEAKVYTAVKNVRNASVAPNKKTVYKSVLNSPFILKWPSVPSELGNNILNQLIKTLEPVGQYRKAWRKKRRLSKKKSKDADPQPEKVATDEQLQEPDLNKRIHIGINSVTRFLEGYIQQQKRSAKNKTKASVTPVIYICKREIKPLQLCQHVLSMAALAKVKLVTMPADAEMKISQVLGVPRTCAILLEIMENKEESLRLSASDIPYIEAPWLNNALLAVDPIQYRTENTIRTIQTTAPDVKKGGQQQQQKKQKEKHAQQQQQQQTLKRKIGDAEKGTKQNVKKIKS